MTNEQKLKLLAAFRVYMRALADSKRMTTRAELYNFRTNGTDAAGYTKRINKARSWHLRAMKAFQAEVRKTFSWRTEIHWDGQACAAILHKEKGRDVPDHVVFGTPQSHHSKAAMLAHMGAKEKALRPLRAKLADAIKRRDYYRLALAENMLEFQRVEYEMKQIRAQMTRSANIGIDNLSGADRSLYAGIPPLQKIRVRTYVAIPRQRRELERLEARVVQLTQEIGI